MDLNFSNGEKVIKSWDYAKNKRSVKNVLTVTNKRIISTTERKKGVDRKEIPLDDVKTVDAFLGKQNRGIWKTIVAIIVLWYSFGFFGMAFMCLSEALVFYFEPEVSFFVFFILSVSCAILGIWLLIKRKIFYLRFVLRGNRNDTSLDKKTKIGKKLNAPILPLIATVYCLMILVVFFGRAWSYTILGVIIIFALIGVWRRGLSKNVKEKVLRARVDKAAVRKTKVKARVDFYVAGEIIDQLGAVLLEAKSA